MWLITKLRKLFSQQPFKALPLKDRAEIVEAFEYRGRIYYTFNDIFRLPTCRGLMALDYYEEFNMRCTKEYLTKVCDAFEVILSNTKKLDLIKIATIVKHMRERLTMLPVKDHVLKLASVMYFDAKENPYFYDREYAQKKIDRWRKDPEVLDFFLQQPLKDLVPFLDTQKASLHSYSAVTEQLNKIHMKEVMSHLSLTDMTIDM